MKLVVGILLLSFVTEAAHARLLGRGGGHHGGGGGGGGTTGDGYSEFPPGDHCNAASSCSSPAQYVVPLPIPSVIDGTGGGIATITSSKACQQVFHNSWGGPCGSPAEVWAYNSEWPGPTVVTKKGTPFNIKHVNNLGQDYENHDISITTHHHGLHIQPAFDGHPQPDYVTDSSFGIDKDGMIYPGNDYTYETTNDQEPGTHWYHDHKMHDTGRNVIMGLAGFFLIKPNEDSLYNNVQNLPSGDYEVGLAFQDRSFTATNQFDYPMNWDELKASGLVNGGYFGDTMLVNGVHAPYMNVKRGWYRFRVLNGCDARQLRLEVQTSGGSRRDIMYQVGTEGGHIATRTHRSSIYMAPGERYDILIDFSSYSTGTKLYLRNTWSQSPSLPDMMQFRVVSGTATSFNVPNSLVSYSWPTNPTVGRSFSLQGPMNGGSGPWTIGGIMYDPDAANLQVRRHTTERWTFSAMMSNHPHPMHLHLVQFHIDGVNTGSLEDGWKDIVMVPANGQRSITAHFDGEPGIYMFHCHNLEHEDYDMMLQYEICDDSDPEHLCDPALLGAFNGGGGMGGGM
mmetsp:Transcript_14122/g.20861  ORF Transcript_14122/g.20861 Transcript_14122/m.20861 type:complete len:566 (+) Transcript_14122:1-1698(+)